MSDTFDTPESRWRLAQTLMEGFHQGLTCGACGGPLEDDRTVVCHACTQPDPAWLAELERPCPRGCPHPIGDHGLDLAPDGLGLRVVCCAGCQCGSGGVS